MAVRTSVKDLIALAKARPDELTFFECIGRIYYHKRTGSDARGKHALCRWPFPVRLPERPFALLVLGLFVGDE